jgi:formate/nitrite transporter
MMINRRILIIDDEPTIRESCRRIFGEQGFEVDAAATGQEGMDRARTGYYDCALVDLRMPDMDGMEIVRQLRDRRQHTAVVIITGYGAVESAAEATRLGVSDYVGKPFSPDEIIETVARALEGSPRTGMSASVDRLAKEIRDNAARPELYENRSPQAVAQVVAQTFGMRRVTSPFLNLVVLGVLAGVYIGFGAQLATLVGHDAAAKVGLGIAQVLSGGVFSVGLMLVVIAGAELFTGNNLMIASVFEKRFGVRKLLASWAVVYLANFAGALLLVWIMYEAGLWKMGGNGVGVKALAIANAKAALPFGEAFFRGLGCNWLVCLAVWMALSAKEIPGKILAILFPIMAFVALGYEHCVANMYFIPLGLLLKNTAAATGMELGGLTVQRFLVGNLVPVTLGNIVGGALFVGSLYWLVYTRTQPKAPAPAGPGTAAARAGS